MQSGGNRPAATLDTDVKSATLILDPLAVHNGIGLTNCPAFVTCGF
jgi:hypothetical protein